MEHKIAQTTPSPSSYPKDITHNIRIDLLEKKRVVVGTMFREVELLDEIESNPNQSHPLLVAWQAGFRIVVIDCERKACNLERLATYCKIAHKLGVSLWLRPAQLEEEAISRFADIGFSGFMIPNAIELPRIRKVVDQAYYLPIARKQASIKRGYSITSTLLDGQSPGALPVENQMNYVNNNMIVALQTEHPKGIENLAELLSISEKGIIGTIIGPNDLAINLSQLEGVRDLLALDKDKMFEHEAMLRAYASVGRIASDNKKAAGVHFTEKNQVKLIKRLIAEDRFHNYRLILFGTERNLVPKEFEETKDIVKTLSS